MAKKRGDRVTKSKFVGVRLTPAQQEKLVLASLITKQPGNMSEGLRWLIDNSKVTGSVSAEPAGHQPEREMQVQHA